MGNSISPRLCRRDCLLLLEYGRRATEIEQTCFFQENKTEYQEFVDKFKPKLTTDDCYTPPIVYEAVAEWCKKEYGIKKEKIVRPFYPGGDYVNFAYQEDSVVVDNPPFSLLASIIRLYTSKILHFSYLHLR